MVHCIPSQVWDALSIFIELLLSIYIFYSCRMLLLTWYWKTGFPMNWNTILFISVHQALDNIFHIYRSDFQMALGWNLQCPSMAANVRAWWGSEGHFQLDVMCIYRVCLSLENFGRFLLNYSYSRSKRDGIILEYLAFQCAPLLTYPQVWGALMWLWIEFWRHVQEVAFKLHLSPEPQPSPSVMTCPIDSTTTTGAKRTLLIQLLEDSGIPTNKSE